MTLDEYSDIVEARQYSESKALATIHCYSYADCKPEDARKQTSTMAQKQYQWYITHRRGKGNCTDCGTPIDKRVLRCRSCAGKNRWARERAS